MHVEYFTYFSDFAKTMSISKTAANFFMTPQGISRAIHSLEKEFGTPLISRSKNSLSLTEAGYSLVEDANHLVEAYNTAHRRMINYAASEKIIFDHTINLYVTPFVSTYVLPLLDIYSSRNVEFSLNVHESNLYKIIPRIKSGLKQHSFALVSVPEISQFEDALNEVIERDELEFFPVMRLPVQALVSVSSPLAGYKKLKVKELKEYPVVMYNDPVLFDILAEKMGKDNIVMTTSSFAMLQMELEKNHAVTFVPAIAAAIGLPNASVLKPLVDGYCTRLGFLGTKESMTNSLNMKVVDCVKSFFAENQNQSAFKGTYIYLEP